MTHYGFDSIGRKDFVQAANIWRSLDVVTYFAGLPEREVLKGRRSPFFGCGHDISTVTGEEVVVFTLAESPVFRQTKRK